MDKTNAETPKQSANPNMSQKDIPIHCLKDMYILNKVAEKRVVDKISQKRFAFPVYICPRCHRYYTSLNRYNDKDKTSCSLILRLLKFLVYGEFGVVRCIKKRTCGKRSFLCVFLITHTNSTIFSLRVVLLVSFHKIKFALQLI